MKCHNPNSVHICFTLHATHLHNLNLHCNIVISGQQHNLQSTSYHVEFYVLLTVHPDAFLGNDQLDALFLNVFILCLYMFRAERAHHQEVQIVLIHHLV
jgi:hypothetical protein